MSLSMLRYRSTSVRVCFTSSISSAVCSTRASEGSNSPLSGGAVDTIAQAAADIMVQI